MRVDFVGPGSRDTGLTILASVPNRTESLRIDLQSIIKSNAGEWTGFFRRWLGELNRRNAGLEWWAYTSTAKNLLSSGLGSRLFEVLAFREVLALHQGRFVVSGATPGQMDAIAGLLRDQAVEVGGSAYRWRGWRRAIQRTEGLLRQFYQSVRVWLSFGFIRGPAKLDIELCVFTYMDAPRRGGVDAYFGRLHQFIKNLRPDLRFAYATYIYAPYRNRIRELARVADGDAFPAFALLTSGDFLRALYRAIRALFPGYPLSSELRRERALVPLLEESLIEDVRVGGYLHNLLVYYSMQRLAAGSAIKALIYPYENKSLEKALLLGVRAGKPSIEVVGYQHTSITPRHVTLLFEPGEAEITPLPDRIVTVGEITRRYLERHGCYPTGIFATGCALRQAWNYPLPRDKGRARCPRVLLALSSSKAELLEAVSFMRSASEAHGLEVAVRAHPNFPLSLLTADLRAWVTDKANDLSGTELADNLQWCDAVAYVSSTVALEALMRGRPVVNLRLSDAIDADPLIEPVPLAWKVESPKALADVLSLLRELHDDDFAARQAESITKMRDYFRPISNEALRHFVPA
jgi:hypothetical protein